MTIFKGSMDQNRVPRIGLTYIQSIALFKGHQDHSMGKGKILLNK